MKQSILAIVLLMIGLQLSCSQLKASNIDKTVIDFIHLLVSDEVVTLSDYEKFYGQSSEQELIFELRTCKERGWDSNSNNCISFIRERWALPEKKKSLSIAWIKEEFSTVGANYEVISSNPSTEGFKHSLVKVLIGNHKFVLFQNTSSDKATGILIGVTSVDGRSIQLYLSDN